MDKKKADLSTETCFHPPIGDIFRTRDHAAAFSLALPLYKTTSRDS